MIYNFVLLFFPYFIRLFPYFYVPDPLVFAEEISRISALVLPSSSILFLPLLITPVIANITG